MVAGLLVHRRVPSVEGDGLTMAASGGGVACEALWLRLERLAGSSPLPAGLSQARIVPRRRIGALAATGTLGAGRVTLGGTWGSFTVDHQRR